MNLNNKIGWCDATWNPYTGCENTCEFCYARKLAEGRLKGRFGYENGFEPTFHPDRLQEPYHRKTPTKIFVSSMGDIFGAWVKEWWVSAIMEVVYDNPQHIFQFLTKFPENIRGFLEFAHVPVLPSNMWVGTSVTCGNDMWRVDFVRKLPGVGKRFVSFEPLLSNIDNPHLLNIDWAIIGAQTGNHPNKVSPEFMWISSLTNAAEQSGIPVYHKDNLKPHVPDLYVLRKNFPDIGGNNNV